jgi:hypothetical protein
MWLYCAIGGFIISLACAVLVIAAVMRSAQISRREEREMDLKRLAIETFQRQQEEQVEGNKQELVELTNRSARQFEKIFGFPPENPRLRDGYVECDGLVFRQTTHDHRSGLEVMLECPKCGEGYFHGTWIWNLLDLGQILSINPEDRYHPGCLALEASIHPAIEVHVPTEEILLNALREFIQETCREI